MKKNMGLADKIIRILIAAAVTILYVTNVLTGTLALVLLILSGVLILTAFVSFCPIYWPFGISTRAKKSGSCC